MDSQELLTQPLYRYVSIRVSEYLREAAVLVLVFAILDKVVFGHAMDGLYVVLVVLISAGILGLGMVLERRFGHERH